ncbi:MAG: hypothetical protein KAG66_12345, partial [Methylococcales bacterium]|nr:hypothetical protein [Methylococcales bacterium]
MPFIRLPFFQKLILSIAICFVVEIASAAPVTLHVKPDGPISSLTQARDEIRKQRAAGEKLEFRVIISDGTYSTTEAIAFSPQDSRTKYEAAKGAKPIISGGRKIIGWTVGMDGLWTVKLPEVTKGTLNFEQLWVNGKRAVRAREPNQFFNYMRRVKERPLKDGPAGVARQTIVVDPS